MACFKLLLNNHRPIPKIPYFDFTGLAFRCLAGPLTCTMSLNVVCVSFNRYKVDTGKGKFCAASLTKNQRGKVAARPNHLREAKQYGFL